MDSLPILAPEQGDDQLLAVFKVRHGTEEECASFVDKIKCLCFGTTVINTGFRSRDYILLEQTLEKVVLWLACRHYIIEVILESVVLQTLSRSSELEIFIFKEMLSLILIRICSVKFL